MKLTRNYTIAEVECEGVEEDFVWVEKNALAKSERRGDMGEMNCELGVRCLEGIRLAERKYL